MTFFTLSCLASIVALILPTTSFYMSWIGKVGITCNFNVIYVFIPELFTSGMRTFGMALPNATSRIFNLAAPYFKLLKNLEFEWEGYVLNGRVMFWGVQAVFTGFACFICTFLPETGKMDPPETEDDIVEQEKYRLLKMC